MDPQKFFADEVRRLKAAYDAGGASALASFTSNEVGLFGLATTAEADRLRAKLAERDATAGDKAAFAAVRRRQLEIAAEFKKRVREFDQSRGR